MAGILVFFIPFLAAFLAYSIPSNRYRPYVMPAAAFGHLMAAITLMQSPARLSAEERWLELDPAGQTILISISVLFFCCALYAPAYLYHRLERPNRIFCSCMLLLLSLMSLVPFIQHVGLIWVVMEATTLCSGPLIFFNRTSRSIEAAWKYLMICSVGIALALLGSFFLAYSTFQIENSNQLLFPKLAQSASLLSKPWLRAAFVTLLVGYGTKMGIAPLHVWKPDAYGETSGIVGALLAGGLTSCAFLVLLRIIRIMYAAGEAVWTNHILIVMGLLSMTFAAVFMSRQKDYKRILAYSSVEHMGILLLGVGIGSLGLWGSLFHVWNNALGKAVLFLSSGNIHRAFGSKSTDSVRGALHRIPVSASLFLLGFIAITGSPPFGPFVSEFAILQAAFFAKQYKTGALYLALMLAVFLGMGTTVLSVIFGEASKPVKDNQYKDSTLTVGPIILLLLLMLIAGVCLPSSLGAILTNAVAFMEVAR
ncbi:MAG: proton-conducting transporter membrane subunit [Candidatus Omnitrophota bacterium]